MPRLLITTFGSYGDLFPYLALGSELRGRGHQVTIATSPIYRGKVEAEDLAFHPVRPEINLDDRELLTYVMDARRGSERLLRFISSVVRESYEDFSAAAESADAILTHPATPAAVLVAQKRELPWVSSVLAPLSFLSTYDPPVLAPAPWLASVRSFGPTIARMIMQAVFFLSRGQMKSWMRPLLDFRDGLGLPDRGLPLMEGQHSPALVLALFSKTLAEPQPDWPAHTVVTGFPFFDRGELSPELDAFLSSGPPPIVFTLGSSAVGAARDFYVHSFQAAEKLGARAVFLTGSHPQGLPEQLPSNMLAVPYAPHGAVFARGALTVHQGGIGTTAQAMRSGHPMLVVPFAHDQFDNAARVRRLGVAEALPQSRYDARRAEELLRLLLSQSSYAEAALQLATQVNAENGYIAAVDAIEKTFQWK